MSQLPASITLQQLSNGRWQCPFEKCTHTCAFRYLLIPHFRKHYRHLNWYQCKHCSFAACEMTGVLRHLRGATHKMRNPKVDVDWVENDQTIDQLANLFRSAKLVRLDNSKPHQCDKCQAKFTTLNALNHHVKTLHLQQNLKECNGCPYVDKSLGHFYRHVTATHLSFKYCGRVKDCSADQVKEMKSYLKTSTVTSTVTSTTTRTTTSTATSTVTSTNKTKSPFDAAKLDLKKGRQLEKQFLRQVALISLDPKARLRSFNYMLCDPRVLPRRSSLKFSRARFTRFVKSTFYIGVGVDSRPYDHDKDAKDSPKLQKRREILESKNDVFTHIFFHGMSPVEERLREAVLLKTIGLANLTNQIASSWRSEIKLSQNEVVLLGHYWLYQAFMAYLFVGVHSPFVRKPEDDDDDDDDDDSDSGDEDHNNYDGGDDDVLPRKKLGKNFLDDEKSDGNEINVIIIDDEDDDLKKDTANVHNKQKPVTESNKVSNILKNVILLHFCIKNYPSMYQTPDFLSSSFASPCSFLANKKCWNNTEQ